MYCVSAAARFGLRCGIVAFVSAITVLAISSDPADARSRKRAHAQRAVISATAEPRYADIVVDANSGDVLHAVNADSQRHPASLTKIMTLYLLFERMEAGKLKLDTPLEVSANATEQAPSKLGLRAGQTIEVEDAIKALVTKSANDTAVVIAEALAGDEESFAKLMTRKARALGMSRTVYKNASGLPDDDQLTTARDQALLALAIQDRFPKYYRYFSTPRFLYHGNWMRNHNQLLGRVPGVDGIKTGYTRASGFNLVTSVHRGNRHIIAVVFGGRTAGQRDARMRELIEDKIAEATTRRTAPKVTETAEVKDKDRPASEKKTRLASAGERPATRNETKKNEVKPKSDPVTTASLAIPRPAPESATATNPAPLPGSTDPIKPLLVKTLSVKPGTFQTASVAPLTLLSPQPVTSQTHANLGFPGEAALPPPPPGARPGVLGVLSAKTEAKPEVKETPSASMPNATTTVTREARVRSGWIIQVGAFDDEAEAKQRLSSARSKAGKLLGAADPFTEPVSKGDKTLYRARFAGLKQNQAEAACRYLKRNDIACMAIRN